MPDEASGAGAGDEEEGEEDGTDKVLNKTARARQLMRRAERLRGEMTQGLGATWRTFTVRGGGGPRGARSQ